MNNEYKEECNTDISPEECRTKLDSIKVSTKVDEILGGKPDGYEKLNDNEKKLFNDLKKMLSLIYDDNQIERYKRISKICFINKFEPFVDDNQNPIYETFYYYFLEFVKEDLEFRIERWMNLEDENIKLPGMRHDFNEYIEKYIKLGFNIVYLYNKYGRERLDNLIEKLKS